MDELKRILCDAKDVGLQYDSLLNRFQDKSIRPYMTTGYYWLLLAKFVVKCPPAQLSCLQQRLQTRLIEASKLNQYTLGSLHFICVTLKRLPTIVLHNQQLLYETACRCVSFACEDGLRRKSDVTLRLAVEIWSTVKNGAYQPFTCTISALLSAPPPYSNQKDVLQLDVMKRLHNINARAMVAATLWNVVAGVIDLADEGCAINLDDVIDAFEKSFSFADNNKLRDEALDALRRIIASVGYQFSIVSRRVLQIINGSSDVSDTCQWQSVEVLLHFIGGQSLLNAKFSEYAQTAINLLESDLDDIPEELAQLLVAFLRTSLPYLNARMICELQSVVCLKMMSPTTSSSVNILKVLNALMEFSHDEVPLPIQIAQKIFHNYNKRRDSSLASELERGRILCGVHSHPRVVNFVIDNQ